MMFWYGIWGAERMHNLAALPVYYLLKPLAVNTFSRHVEIKFCFLFVKSIPKEPLQDRNIDFRA